MANIKALKAGNHNDPTVWDGGVVPGPMDTVFCNNFTVQIVADWEVESINNAADPISGALLGGKVALAAGCTLTADCNSANGRTIECHGAGERYIFGTVTGGNTTNASGIYIEGTVYVTRILPGSAHNANGAYYTAGTLIVDETSGGPHYSGHGISNGGSGIAIIGTALGNDVGTSSALRAASVSPSTVEEAYAPTVQAGSTIHNSGTGRVSVGIVHGGHLTSAGTYATRTVVSQGPGFPVEMRDVRYSSSHIIPYSDYCSIDPNNPSMSKYDKDGNVVSLLSAGALSPEWFPAIANVRDGVIYANGGLVGTCKVPTPESVSAGVPVDNTVGIALITPAQLLDAIGHGLAALSGG